MLPVERSRMGWSARSAIGTLIDSCLHTSSTASNPQSRFPRGPVNPAPPDVAASALSVMVAEASVLSTPEDVRGEALTFVIAAALLSWRTAMPTLAAPAVNVNGMFIGPQITTHLR